jgi:glycosyltransferase involved in cell wall biosynthesis
MPKLSIIIPTYNRGDILLKTLEAYKCQTAVNEILEVIVIDDGSTDGTAMCVANYSLTSPFPIRYLCQDHGGPAKGRNYAIRESQGEIILMGDDDIIPSPNLVAEHLVWHKKYPMLSDAVLGRVEWSPDVNPTPFMEWLAQDGVMFCYGHMRKGQLRDPHFYSCNLSVKKDFLCQNGTFDEQFPAAAFEDIELGHRLSKKGLRLFYNPDAVGYHHKKMSVADACQRAEMVENAYELFRTKVPTGEGFNPNPKRSAIRRTLKARVQEILSWVAPVFQLFDTQIPFPWVVYRIFYFYYILPRVRAKLSTSTRQPDSYFHQEMSHPS